MAQNCQTKAWEVEFPHLDIIKYAPPPFTTPFVDMALMLMVVSCEIERSKKKRRKRDRKKEGKKERKKERKEKKERG